MSRDTAGGSESGPASAAPDGVSRPLQRALGVVLAALVLLPMHMMLAGRDTGIAGDQFVRLGPGYGFLLWAGTAAVVAIGAASTVSLGAHRVLAGARRVGGVLTRGPTLTFGLIMAALGGLLTAWFSLAVLGGRPSLVDAASQLVNARYLAEGRLGGPPLPGVEFWDFQYMLETPAGWVSQYPPGQLLVLAVGLAVGAVWVVGPAMMALTVFFSVLIAERVFPRQPATARLGGLLVATSPFLVGLAGAYMSHVTAAAAGAAALYFALRSKEDSAGWALACGAALGAMVITRPLSGIATGMVATAGVWGLSREKPGARGVAVCGALVALGGLPFALFFGWYNQALFGSPFRLGYTAAQGPSHGLGFHVDPWGASYGPLEALAYTGGELRALSFELLQTPVPAVLVLAAVLIFQRSPLPRGLWVLLAWALIPIVANTFYWHHDLVMGPRMINETAPAWCLLIAFASIRLVEMLGSRPSPRAARSRVSRRREREKPAQAPTRVPATVTSALLVSLLVAWVGLAPIRLLDYGRRAVSGGWSMTIPAGSGPSLVFVHGGWQARLGARMVALGIGADSIRSALAENATCSLHGYLDRVEAGEQMGAGGVPIRFRPGGPPLRALRTPGGSTIRALTSADVSPECQREIGADFYGVIGLPQLLWLGDLPGLDAEGPMFVRDMGPEKNAGLLARFSDRAPKMLLIESPGAEPVLVEYEEGVERLWNRAELAPGDAGGS